MTDHILKKIDAEIASLRSRVLALSEQVKAQLNDATTLLEKCYLERGVSVDRLEEKINELQVAVDRECLQFIALHKPSAGDLRTAISMMRVVTDLEAIGNAAVQITRSGERVHKGVKREVPAVTELNSTFVQLKTMLQAAIAGFERNDAQALIGLAREQHALAQRVDSLCSSLADAMAEGGNNVKVQMEVVDIARTTNNIGALCQSIGAHIVFMVSGNDLRHASVAQIEQSLVVAG
jgi:phosphate transport system protein